MGMGTPCWCRGNLGGCLLRVREHLLQTSAPAYMSHMSGCICPRNGQSPKYIHFPALNEKIWFCPRQLCCPSRYLCCGAQKPPNWPTAPRLLTLKRQQFSDHIHPESRAILLDVEIFRCRNQFPPPAPLSPPGCAFLPPTAGWHEEHFLRRNTDRLQGKRLKKRKR